MPLESIVPFDATPSWTALERRCLMEWRGALLFQGFYAPTAMDLRSKNTHEVVLIMRQGVVREHEGEIDGRGFRFGATRRGQIAVFPQAVRMDFRVVTASIHNCELYFPPRFATEQLGFPDERPLVLAFARTEPFLCPLIDQLVALSNRDDDLALMQKDTLFHALAVHLFAQSREGVEGCTPPLSQELTVLRAQKLRQHIDEHLHLRLSCDQLAKLADCDRRDFSSAFRRTFGSTPAQYVLDRRLDRAVRLITNTAVDFSEIAYRVGFSSHSHLTTALRLRRGVTPSQLRGRSSLPLVSR